MMKMANAIVHSIAIEGTEDDSEAAEAEEVALIVLEGMSTLLH